MSNPKGNDRQNIFEILDGMMFQLSRTKKMFMIMILTVLILPPVALIVMSSVMEPSFQQQFEQRLQNKLDRGEITEEEYDEIKSKFGERRSNQLLRPSQMIIFAISIGWLGVGIRQWIILSKWDKRYKQFKAQQEEIDKEFEEDEDKDDKS
ncbi:SHOCT domain-containing protein [Nitrosopumilus sp.]|uniref:SHOCT domain-containing protein n=1 Tax=Nitrosopumilus sp. TaxID=2024843 RepID=UPI003D125A92